MRRSLSARPAVSVDDAVIIARERYGLEVDASELGSTQDRNFLLTDGDGKRSVLRVDNEHVSDEVRDSQHAAIDAYRDAGISTVVIIPGDDGELVQRWNGYAVRLSEFVGGIPLLDAGYLAPSVLAGFGRLAAASVAALAPLDHPGFEREHMWDLRAAYEETVSAAPSIADERLRTQVTAAAESAWERVARVVKVLPVQAVHGDITDDNVMGALAEDSRVYPETVFDFGDLSYGWRVAEIVVTATSMLQHDLDRPLRIEECVLAYHQQQPLTREEAEVFWPLVILRSALLVASGHGQLAIDPDNAYVLERIDGKYRALLAATRFDLAELTEHLLGELGFESPDPELIQGEPQPPLKTLLPELDGSVVVVDLNVEADDLDSGRWLQRDVEEKAVAEKFDGGATAVVFPYGQFRLTRTSTATAEAAETWPVETEIRLRSERELAVHAPLGGTVRKSDGREIVLDLSEGWCLRLTGASSTAAVGVGVEQGERIATLGASGSLTVGLFRLLPTRLTEGAALVIPDLVPAWARLSADPAPMLGLESRRESDRARAETERREQIFAKAQQRYYDRPMQIERGWREHLVDTTGRSYVDMVNNVAVAGHGHPGIADAAERQLRKLNTNSRFLYDSLADYSERLLAKMPQGSGLDTVLLVNSGSEAVDLALRLVQAATGRRSIVTLREAYHGWTVGATAVTNNAKDNRFAFSSRPDWVRIADIPNAYRGAHRGADAGARYAESLGAELEALEEAGEPAAGFICESLLGNAGGILMPEGYLADAYRRVRDAGGMCIADEVQLGFGRLGESFWGFELSGVTPDVVTVAKAMGNGYPIGAVITSKRVADALADQGQFFSSAGGNPLSCQVGLAVLDAIESEGLQQNAYKLGRHFAAGIERLAERHEIIGALHGTGLYRGIELVRDRETLEPATAEARAISERLKDLGVIMQPTSERSNVLKVKPPLCISETTIDFVLRQIDTTLTNGW